MRAAHLSHNPENVELKIGFCKLAFCCMPYVEGSLKLYLSNGEDGCNKAPWVSGQEKRELTCLARPLKLHGLQAKPVLEARVFPAMSLDRKHHFQQTEVAKLTRALVEPAAEPFIL